MHGYNHEVDITSFQRTNFVVRISNVSLSIYSGLITTAHISAYEILRSESSWIGHSAG